MSINEAFKHPAEIKKIAKSLDTAFYIYHEDNVIKNFNNLLSAFKRNWENSYIAYSYKTNYIPDLVKCMDNLGAFPEVVSDMEHFLAEKQSNRPIFFNGPDKSISALRNAVVNDSVINLDCFEEIKILKSLLPLSQNKKVKLGIRVNFKDVGSEFSRFGFSFENGDFQKAIKSIRKDHRFEFFGVHCHVANRSLATFEKMVLQIKNLLSKCFSDKELSEINFISLGGGFYGKMPKLISRQLGLEKTPSFREYSSKIKPLTKFLLEKNASSINLILEPGTAVAADSLSLVCKVISHKKVDTKDIYSTNGSLFNLFGGVKNKINLPFYVISNGHKIKLNKTTRTGKTYIAGYTCIEDDFLTKESNIKLNIGSLVCYPYAGSYSVVMKPPFIKPDIPIYKFKNGRFKLIKDAQTNNEVFQNYRLINDSK